MSKLKIEPGVSRVKRAKLQSSMDQTIARDIELMAQWSDNEPTYVVNELLHFAISAFRNLWHPLMEHRVMLSLGLSIACGIVLQSL